MQLRPINEADRVFWAHLHPREHSFTGPGEIEADIMPCPALVTDNEEGDVDQFGHVVRVPWTLNEIELMHLAKGGTLWLSTWGGLPIHQLRVQPPNEMM